MAELYLPIDFTQAYPINRMSIIDFKIKNFKRYDNPVSLVSEFLLVLVFLGL